MNIFPCTLVFDVDQAAAFRAGIVASHTAKVKVDPAKLAPEDRELIARYIDLDLSKQAARQVEPHLRVVGVLATAPTIEGLIEGISQKEKLNV